MYFLASIPRSGSTLLASLLGQREDTYVSPTSNLGDTLGAVTESFKENPATKASGQTHQDLYATLRSISEFKYSDRSEPIIFDKGRMWADPKVINTMEKSIGEIKIVATVRPMAECVASFYLIDKSKLSINEWVRTSRLMAPLMAAYQALKEGYEKYPEKFCLIEYANLCGDTQNELNRISDFIGVDRQTFQPDIKQVDEKDNAWGIENLHTLAETIKETVQDTKGILGPELYEFYQGGEFWNDDPEPISKNHPLNLALEAGLRGNFEKGYKILNEIERINPNNRAKFNLGWYELMRGNLQRGHGLLDYGRVEGVFGNNHIGTNKPIWSGQRGVNILMEMEGGFGDQFACIRFSKNFAELGNKVIIGGGLPLAPIMRDVEGVSIIVDHKASALTDHDFWVPSMSAIVALGMEYSDMSGKPYISRDGESEGKVGVKWSGNPKFEHEQHRLFPKEKMWDAVKELDCISLQRGDKDEPDNTPEWMEKVCLETWSDTRKQISRCDLIITSCTGVAHLAGAMGIDTWIVVPVLSYYMWALPGDKTPYYDSVTLFRQEKYGCWQAPFKKIKQALIHRRTKSWSKPNYDDYRDTTRQFIEA